MIEIVWQYDPQNPTPHLHPSTAEEARLLLEKGNQAFARFMAAGLAGAAVPAGASGPVQARHVTPISPQDLGLSPVSGVAPKQEPFAAFLSCADARAPVEMIFNQATNDLFVVRVAGNVLGAECLGSLDYAVDQLGSVRLLAVMGHTSCGAVSAAVDAFLHPTHYLSIAANLPLRSVIDGCMAAVSSAAAALEEVHGRDSYDRPGFRAALIESSVVLNAALTAAILSHAFAGQLGETLNIVYGVYDLVSRQVGVPGEAAAWEPGLLPPPEGNKGLLVLGRRVVSGPYIGGLLA
jgi:carbonic anhydrase